MGVWVLPTVWYIFHSAICARVSMRASAAVSALGMGVNVCIPREKGYVSMLEASRIALACAPSCRPLRAHLGRNNSEESRWDDLLFGEPWTRFMSPTVRASAKTFIDILLTEPMALLGAPPEDPRSIHSDLCVADAGRRQLSAPLQTSRARKRPNAPKPGARSSAFANVKRDAPKMSYTSASKRPHMVCFASAKNIENVALSSVSRAALRQVGEPKGERRSS